MSDHMQQLFSRTGGAEAFDPMLDYKLAAERKATPRQDGLRLIGRVAQLFTQTPEDAKRVQDRFSSVANSWKQRIASLNERRRAEKTERQADAAHYRQGRAISQFEEIMQDQTEAEAARYQPRAVVGEPGAYRSNFSGEQPRPEPTDQETDKIMARAVRRARRNLGALPIITMQAQAHEQTQATSQPSAPEDAALIARLQKAYNEPAIPPERRNTSPRHAAPEDEDDRLTTTAA